LAEVEAQHARAQDSAAHRRTARPPRRTPRPA
jgi:hypothetical protein